APTIRSASEQETLVDAGHEFPLVLLILSAFYRTIAQMSSSLWGKNGARARVKLQALLVVAARSCLKPQDSRTRSSGMSFFRAPGPSLPEIRSRRSSAASRPSWYLGNSTVVSLGRKMESHG